MVFEKRLLWMGQNEQLILFLSIFSFDVGGVAVYHLFSDSQYLEPFQGYSRSKLKVVLKVVLSHKGGLLAQWLGRWLVIERSRVRLPASPLPSNNSGQVVHTHLSCFSSPVVFWFVEIRQLLRYKLFFC